MKILIGPNGFGKTRKLNDYYGELNKEETIFLESEILLLDELKDTKDTTKTMEYFIDDLLFNDENYKEKKEEFEKVIDGIVDAKKPELNKIVEDVLKINDMDRSKDFFNTRGDKEYKKLLKIESEDFKKKMGSGQRMHFLLKLVIKSSKKNIIIDEPEKFSHPTLISKTAQLLNEISKVKNLIIATHSPFLISHLEFDYDDLEILNDSTYAPKKIDFKKELDSLSKDILIENLSNASKSYYSLEKLLQNINHFHKKEFVNAIFSKNVLVCEGVSEELFVKRLLSKQNKQFLDYSIFCSYGKHHMPVFCKIFESLGINVIPIFDKDNEANKHVKKINDILNKYEKKIMFDEKFEDEVTENTFGKHDYVKLMEHLDSFSFSKKYTDAVDEL